jgi:hypothetical protein
MEAVITLVIAIIAIVAHIIKNMQESAQAKQVDVEKEDNEELVILTRPKPNKQGKPMKTGKQRPSGLHSLGDSLGGLGSEPTKRQALSKKLSPQGEGQRFEADPGTLDAMRIVAPTFDPIVKPELESITGIYEEGAMFSETTKPAITLNIADYLAKPEGIIHAVILAEVLNRPDWSNSRFRG